jgi:hypothetical protein
VWESKKNREQRSYGADSEDWTLLCSVSVVFRLFTRRYLPSFFWTFFPKFSASLLWVFNPPYSNAISTVTVQQKHQNRNANLKKRKMKIKMCENQRKIENRDRNGLYIDCVEIPSLFNSLLRSLFSIFLWFSHILIFIFLFFKLAFLFWCFCWTVTVDSIFRVGTINSASKYQWNSRKGCQVVDSYSQIRRW